MLHFEDTFTVWNAYGKDYVLDISTTKNGKEYANVAITSSSKDKTTGKYDTDWKGQIKFYGNALEKIKGMGLQMLWQPYLLKSQRKNQEKSQRSKKRRWADQNKKRRINNVTF